MIILKEWEAVDYLQRARSCIHPEDCINQLQLIRAMLDIEAGYIESLIGTQMEDMAKITIDASGFPELGEWKVDIKEAFQRYESLRIEIASGMAPLVASAKTLNQEAIIEESIRAASLLPKYTIYSKAFSSLSSRQKIFLQTELTIYNVLSSTRNSGLLVGWDCRNPFQEEETYPSWHGLSRISEYAGFKYFDSVYDPRMLRVIFCSDTGLESGCRSIRYATPATSMLSKALIFKPNDCNCQGKIAHHNFGKYQDELSGEAKALKQSEEAFEKLHQSSKNTYLSTDFTSISEKERESFKEALWQLDATAKQMSGFLENTINGVQVTPEEFIEKNRLLAAKTEIIENIAEENQRMALHICWAEILDEVDSFIKDIIKKPEESQKVMEPPKAIEVRKKRFFLFG